MSLKDLVITSALVGTSLLGSGQLVKSTLYDTGVYDALRATHGTTALPQPALYRKRSGEEIAENTLEAYALLFLSLGLSYHRVRRHREEQQ